MKKMLKKSLICVLGLSTLSGCVVYARPGVYAYRTYDVYDGPVVVYYHESYRGGYYYHRAYCR